MDLFQHFPSQCGRYEKSGTLSDKSLFDRYVFPKVPIWMKFLWKYPMFIRPSHVDVMHQNFDGRVFTSFLMNLSSSLELYGMFAVTKLTAIIGS